MVYKCKITDVQPGESIKYATPYTYFSDNKQVGRVVFTKKIAGKWKDWYNLSNVIIYSEFRGLGTTCIEKRCFSIHDYCFFTNKNYVFISKKGLCDKMLKCVLKKYTDEKVYLEVDENNIPAIKCYTKCGFTIKEKIKKNYVMILS